MRFYAQHCLPHISNFIVIVVFSQVKKMFLPQQSPDQYVASWEPFGWLQVVTIMKQQYTVSAQLRMFFEADDKLLSLHRDVLDRHHQEEERR